MKYKISLSTYNLDVVEAFTALGNKKSPFVEQALINFLGTKRGKDTINFILDNGKNRPINRAITNGKDKKPLQVDTVNGEDEGSDRISLDGFLK